MKTNKLIFSLVLFLGACIYAQAQFSGTGTGTAADPYQITTAVQLGEMRNFLGTTGSGKHFQLMNDIDLSESIPEASQGWEPIGNSPDDAGTFTGFFHGSGFTIRNLWIDRPASDFVGFFGYIKNGGVDHLTVELDSTRGIRGGENVGIIAGVIEGGLITDCIAKGKITATAYIGGLVGFIKENVDVANNTTVVTIISSEGYVGGLAGQVSSPITNCISSGTLNTSGDNIGGLVGYANATIAGSSSSANVTHTGNIFTGNFMGGLTGVAKFTITNCHASGTVTGSNGIGGLVGDSYAPTIDSHASGNVNGNAYVGGLAGNSDAVINSYASGNVAAYQDMAGGLAGQSYGAIERSYATGAVSGAKSVGGLVGISYMAVSHSFASGNITGTNPDITPEGGLIDIGGLVGNTFNTTTNCYATGNISAQSNSMYIGGLIGFSGGEVASCYASGTIEGEAYGMVGGLIGDAWANVTNSVAANPSITTSASGNQNTVKRLVGLTEFDAEIAGSYALQSMRINGIGGFAGTPEDNQGLNKTTMQLQTGLNYESNMAWDFTTVWTIREGQGYPFFEYVSHLTSIISSSVNNETQGVISPIGDISVEDGSSRSYTITPAEGYEIESVLVDNVNIGTGAAYNFSNIIANHSIVANFRLIVLDIDDRNLVGLKAYPNPVNDVLNISYSEDISSIEVYDLLGQLVIAETANDKQVQVDMSNLASGAYFVKVTSNSKTKTVKIIK